MPGWQKLLADMVADPDPRSYAYEDAARVLVNLGFEPARSRPKGSHRLWRREVEDATGRRTVYVGLVDAGSGTLKPPYIMTMIEILRANGLLPREV